MKFVLKRLTLTFFVSCFAVLLLNVEKLHSQTMTVGDPMVDYLRLFETHHEAAFLPSLLVGPMSAEEYRNQLKPSKVHPWANHPFFKRKLYQAMEVSVDSVSVDTVYAEPYTVDEPLQTHRVQAGETVYSISRMYGITEEDLINWNNLGNDTIYINQELIVEEPPPPVTNQVEPEPLAEPESTPIPASKIQPLAEGGVRLYTPSSKVTYNNNFPVGQNDGALWQGRGLNTVLSAGAYISYGPFRASIRPNFIYSANEDFTLSRWPAPVGISEYGYEFSVIDYPQRFGNASISNIDPGQSWIRADYRKFSVGISTSTMSLGPAVYNPIILSNNAPGFFRFFIETNQPVQTRIGNFEGNVFWGRLNESNYFDDDMSNDRQLINGLTLSFSPKYVEGLHFGLSRIFVDPILNDGVSFGDLFLALSPMQSGTHDDIDRLQMTSLFGRWKVPDYGFEFYAEWARNTAANNFRDLLLQPEYSRAYTLGFLKRFVLSAEHWLSLNFEMTQIERTRSIEYRYSEPFYRSNAVIQGYTHQGQILGAGIGPGSNSQKVHLKYYWKRGLFGASFNRIVHDNTRLYENYMIIGERPWGIRNPYIANEVEFRYGLNAIAFLHENIELQLDVYRTRYFHHEHGILPFETPNVYNTNFQVTLRFHLQNFLR